MAINFPDSPTIGDEFTGGGFTWTWNGSSWEKLAPTLFVAAESGTGFKLRTTGTGNNSTFVLSNNHPAGDYSITSSDTNYDIYFVSASGENVGYANSTTLANSINKIAATSEFNTVVIYGAAATDVYTFTYQPTVDGVALGNLSAGVAPYITSVTETALENINETTVVSGGNFPLDIQVLFVGTDNAERSAKYIVRNSSTELIITRPDILPHEYAPYDIVVKSPTIPVPSSTNVNILGNAVTAGGGVTWQTTSLAPYVVGSAYSSQLSATDADGTNITYSIASGQLPAGLSLSGSGLISGTATASEVQTITFRATDEGNNFADRVFTIDDNSLVEFLVVSGGGGGGRQGAGGGGAGGYISSVTGEVSGANSTIVAPFSYSAGTSYTVTVGAGGAGVASGEGTGSIGVDSRFGSIIPSRGGGGGSKSANGISGGSGGGGGLDYGGGFRGGDGTANQGFRGGDGSPGSNYSVTWRGGGGGGASEAGSTNSESSGGDGLPSFITGQTVYRGGGGAGSSAFGAYGAGNKLGGLGGGGNAGGRTGWGSSQVGTDGEPNTGGGGAGGGGTEPGGESWHGTNGGSGVVIIRFPLGQRDPVTISGLTYNRSEVSGYKIYEFTAGSGTVTL